MHKLLGRIGLQPCVILLCRKGVGEDLLVPTPHKLLTQEKLSMVVFVYLASGGEISSNVALEWHFVVAIDTEHLLYHIHLPTYIDAVNRQIEEPAIGPFLLYRYI